MTQLRIIKEYPYKSQKFIFLSGIALFGLGTWFFMKEALSNDQGLILTVRNLGIDFSFTHAEATILYWVLCILSLILTTMSCLALYKEFGPVKKIILTDEAITAPTPFLTKKKGKPLTIYYKDMKSLNIRTINKIRILEIVSVNAKLKIGDNILSLKSDLDEIINIIEEQRKLAC